MSKAQIVNLRVTAEEKARWEERASLSAMKLAAWIRAMLNDPKPPPAYGIESLPLPLVGEKPDEARNTTDISKVKPAWKEEILPDHPPKQKRDKDGLLPVCERCQRLGNFGMDRNYNCPTCGRVA